MMKMSAPAVVAALIAAASAIVVAAITYWLTKRRERDAEWRKLKLEYYREFVAAMSGITEAGITPEGRRRFATAVNDLSLVAPPDVLQAAYALIQEVNNPTRTDQSYDAALSAFLRVLRRDAHPVVPDDSSLSFKLFGAPAPDMVRNATVSTQRTDA